MKIYILGHPCRICDAVEELVWNVVEEHEVAATIKRVVKDKNIIKYGVSLTPAVVVEHKIKVMGRIPKKEEVLSWTMAEQATLEVSDIRESLLNSSLARQHSTYF